MDLETTQRQGVYLSRKEGREHEQQGKVEKTEEQARLDDMQIDST
jgi:hypothetical protein